MKIEDLRVGQLITSRQNSSLLVFDDVWHCIDSIRSGNTGIVIDLEGRLLGKDWNGRTVKILTSKGVIGFALLEFMGEVK